MSANKILFERSTSKASDSEHYGVVNSNKWDDTKLDLAYDSAMKIAKAEVAKLVAMSTNSRSENREDQKQAKISATSKQPVASSSKTKEWKAGMACRAVYDEDGLEYEAFVLRIVDNRDCIVRFLGYENCEVVSIDSLTPSHGKEERQKQIEQATLEKDDYPDPEWRECGSDGAPAKGKEQKDEMEDGPNLQWRECESDRVPSPGSTEYSFGRKQKSPKKKKGQKPPHFELPDMPFPMPSMRSMMANLGSFEMPLPPPPLMSVPRDRADAEEQAVSSMLMSWYMSGYYTGLYQGMKRAKQGHKRV